MNSLRLLGDWPWPLGIAFALILAWLSWWLYRRETISLASPNSWLLPLLRSAAIFLLLLTLLEPVIHHRVREGNPGRITFLIDGSQSMSISDEAQVMSGSESRGLANIRAALSDSGAATQAESRFARAANLLLRNKQLSLEKLSEEFEVSIRRIDDGQVTALWESNANAVPKLPDSNSAWLPSVWARTSPLGDALLQSRSTVSNGQVDSDSAATRSVVVLLSDGQSNTGLSPLEIASQAAAGQAIYSVGFGVTAEASDLAIQSIDCPPRVFRTDTLRGTLQLKDRIGQGNTYTVSLTVADEVVWKQKLTAENTANRRVEFSLPVAPLYELLHQRLPANAKYAVVPLPISAQINSEIPEANLLNNSLAINSSIAAQRSRLLMLDGRSRWENRYLRNMFDRDPAWQVNCQIAGDLAEFQFPKTRDELFSYDLIVLGDLHGTLLAREHMIWLREFVELNGGGLIVVSGARHNLAQTEYAELQKLFPVSWRSAAVERMLALQRLPKHVQLSSAGQFLSALRLDARGESESQALWTQLPALQFVDKVDVLPGAEVLATASSEIESQPLFVTRRFGSGRVFFSATDETWRWRYKVADLVHQRLWNQLARWVMRTPMAVQGEFVSLDCGAASYALGKSVEVRVQLRDRDGRPAARQSPVALVSVAGELIARVPLIEDPNVPATYFADVNSLPAGDYDVRLEAAGFSREALDVHTNFSVTGPASLEMQNIVCDDLMLRELAEKTGGKYLAESEADQLFPLLRPLSSGRFVESDTIVWQTYGWFAAAMALLVIEWWLRKRAGLV